MIRAESYLASLTNSGIKPGLERIRALTEGLGNPYLQYPIVHVAGTNGKGSVSSYIAGTLREAGYRTGLYTSPHMHRFNERIVVDGSPISDADFDAMLDEVLPFVQAMEDRPTQFDVGTAMAFLYFARQKVDMAVIETGLGGVWDSTNVVQPALSVITSIRLDHADMLGNTVEEVAAQKAGIIKPGAPVVLGPQTPAALEVLVEHVNKVGTRAVHVTRTDAERNGVSVGGAPVDIVPFDSLRWDWSGGRLAMQGAQANKPREYEVGMLGEHQVENAAVAVSAIDVLRQAGWRIPETALKQALLDTRVPGRLEWIPGSPAVLFDGAHNAPGAAQLAIALQRLAKDRTITFVCGLSSDKSPLDVFGPLLSHGHHVVFTKASASRVGNWEPDVLAELTRQIPGVPPATVREPAAEALTEARKMTSPDGLICVCGSLYLVGELRDAMAHENTRAGLIFEGPQ